MGSLAVCLLHENMLDKTGKEVTTSLTLIDLHDISRSARTYGLIHAYVAHPSTPLLNLAKKITHHWQEGYGSTYNPDRKVALDNMSAVASFDEVVADLTRRAGRPPTLVGTTAKDGPHRVSFANLTKDIETKDECFLLMLGTGWGMTEELLARAHCILEPIHGPGEYNHLSVRSACAIMLDRLRGRRP